MIRRMATLSSDANDYLAAMSFAGYSDDKLKAIVLEAFRTTAGYSENRKVGIPTLEKAIGALHLNARELNEQEIGQ